MSNLINALASLDRVEQMLIENGGELTPEIEQEIIFKDSHVGDVVDQEFLKLERIDYIIEFYQKKAEFFSKISSSLNKYKDYRRDQIKQFMITLEKDQITGVDYVFKLAGSAPKVMIVDESAIDPVYLRVKTEVDKKLIGEALKNGIPVTGAVLQENKSLRMSANKGKV